MRMFREPRTGWRTAPATIFLVAVFIVFAGFGIIFQNEAAFRASRDRQAFVSAQVLAGSVTAAVDFNDPAASQQSVDAFRVNPQVRYVGVFNRAGKVLGAYDPSRGRRASEPRAIAAGAGKQLPRVGPGHERRTADRDRDLRGRARSRVAAPHPICRDGRFGGARRARHRHSGHGAGRASAREP